MKATVVECVRQAGALLMKHFGKIDRVTHKEHCSSIVTAADIASEKLILGMIRRRYPRHNVLAEESGLQPRGSDITWVIDPLDGTSNFAVGIPWFGVMIAVLKNGQPVLGAMYLPTSDTLYFSERGHGVLRNGQPVRFTAERNLSNTLCGCGMDGGAGEHALRKQTKLLGLCASRARNVRLTNSLVDFCYTLDGRFGACLNQNCKIWDIAPASLMFPEAGGRFTDLQGRKIRFDLDPASYLRNYPVIGGKPALHKQMLALAKEAGF